MKVSTVIGVIGSIASIIGISIVFINGNNGYSNSISNNKDSPIIIGDGNSIVSELKDKNAKPNLKLGLDLGKINTPNGEIDPITVKTRVVTKGMSGGDFDSLTGTTNTRPYGLSQVEAAGFIVANTGTADANGVWFDLYMPAAVTPFIISTEEFDMNYEDDEERYKISYRSIDHKKLNINSKDKLLVILTLRYPILPESYIFDYIIGDSSGYATSGELTFEVRPDKNIEASVFENERGRLYMRNRDYSKAIEYFLRAVNMNPEVAAYRFNLANAYLRFNNIDEAEKHLLEAIKYEKDKFQIWGNLGAVFYAQGKLKEAKKYMEKTLELKPDSERDRRNLENVIRELNGESQLPLDGDVSKIQVPKK